MHFGQSCCETAKTMLRLLLIVFHVSVAQQGMESMGLGSGRRMRDKEPLAVKSDVAAIACDVCEIAVSEAWRKVEAERAAAPVMTVATRPGVKKTRSTFSEADVNTIITDVCNRRKETGEWLWYVDLVDSKSSGAVWRDLTKKEAKSKKTYLLVERRQRGGPIRKWDRESASVKRSCDRLFDEDIADLEDLIVPLWRGLEEADAKALACKELSSRCSKSRKPVDDDREDFEYEDQDKTLLDTERMMENMAEQGMPMVMQSREDMMDELMENMMAEGLTEEEARDFMDATMHSVRSRFSFSYFVYAGTKRRRRRRRL